MAPKLLIVLTSAATYGENKPTGWYLPELAHPYHILSPHTEITFASPLGGVAPIDPYSIEATKDDPICTSFYATKKDLWTNTAKLSTFLGRASEFDAVFYPGGQGPMFDLATDESSHKLINEFADAKKVIASVCHGPAAFAFVKRPDGTPFLKGAKVTGLKDSEERALGTDKDMPFLLEAELKKVCGEYICAGDFEPCVVVDRERKLITGQSPPSSVDVGKAILDALTKW
ncbi:ThiJ/PfpI [Macrophomina phaseolina MS6]|uniref:D-lactate dehydratase n=1 Tax=Macrophomina phaseolina (strain MS6) TaxID=1126212 RepID=K2T0V0_MACPH|nr:ThiJ/PfpI [Macrophomina phaseolina MS6]